MGANGKIPTHGGGALGQSPFGVLSGAGLPSFVPQGGTTEGGPASAKAKATSDKMSVPERNRGRVDIRRETGNRGGKTVTVIDGFTGIGLPEKEQLAKKMRAACGCGGTVKDGAIEIQGDQRATVSKILTEAGFRPVLAGG